MFATKIFELLGVKGIIIIILLGAIGVQSFAIFMYKQKVKSLNDDIREKSALIATQQGAIELQNRATETLNQEKKDLDARLQETKAKFKKKDIEYQDKINELTFAPKPINCEAAIVELKSQNNIAIKKWNSQ